MMMRSRCLRFLKELSYVFRLADSRMSELLETNVHRNLSPAQLVEAALRRGEAELARAARWLRKPASAPAALPKTSSPSKDSITDDKVHWGSVNQPFSAGEVRRTL